MFASGEKQPWAEPISVNNESSTTTTSNKDYPLSSYGTTNNDGMNSSYQTLDPFAGMANGNSPNFPSRNIEQTSTTIPLTIENPMYRNY